MINANVASNAFTGTVGSLGHIQIQLTSQPVVWSHHNLQRVHFIFILSTVDLYKFDNCLKPLYFSATKFILGGSGD